MQRAKSEYAIQTVSNALRVLEAFEKDEILGVTELAKRLHLHKNNVFRILATLEEKSWVEQCADTERYRLGAVCVRLGHAFGRARSLSRHGRLALEGLARKTQETTHLAVLRGFEVVMLDGVQAPGPLVTGLHLGGRLLTHCTAVGKVLLACGDQEVLERFDHDVAARGKLKKATERSIVDRDKLIEHLQQVRVQGFATDLEECADGVVCAAAPVFDATSLLAGALAVSAPAARVDQAQVERELVPHVVAAATRLSQQLGAPL
jgi:IclR family transcriptional regulator, KDG regulon repressor